LAIANILNFINGEFTTGDSGKTFDVRTPVDNAIIARVHEASSGS